MRWIELKVKHYLKSKSNNDDTYNIYTHRIFFFLFLKTFIILNGNVNVFFFYLEEDSSMELTSDQITSNMDSRLAQDVGEVRPNFPFIGDIDPAGNIVNNKQGTRLFLFYM